MKVIDSRSGTELEVGQTIDRGGGESVTLLAVEPGLVSAQALVRMVYVGGPQSTPVVTQAWTQLAVRWAHPKYFLQHVGFLSS